MRHHPIITFVAAIKKPECQIVHAFTAASENISANVFDRCLNVGKPDALTGA
jgi:hypothetical protein